MRPFIAASNNHPGDKRVNERVIGWKINKDSTNFVMWL